MKTTGQILALAALLSFATASLAQAPQASQMTLYRQLNTFTTYMPVMAISQKVFEAVGQSPSKLPIALAWAQDKSVKIIDPASLNSLYFMIYSDMNRLSTGTVAKDSPYFLEFSKEAIQSLLAFEVLYKTDAARCLAPEPLAAAKDLLASRYDNLKYTYALFVPQEMALLQEKALEIEEKASHRPGNTEICSNIASVEIAKTLGRPIPEKTDPVFIDATEWKTKRDTIRADLAGFWKERTARAAKPQLPTAVDEKEERKAAAEAQARAKAQEKIEAAKAAAEAKRKKEAAEAAQREQWKQQAERDKQAFEARQKQEKDKYSNDSFDPAEYSGGVELNGDQ